MARMIGDRSRRQMVVDYAAEKKPDEVITYGELAVALGVPAAARDVIRSAVNSAGPELTTQHGVVLTSVRGVGYRVIRPEEHVVVAASLQRRAGKTIVQARDTVAAVRLDELSPEGRQIALAAAAALSMQASMIERLDVRQQRLATVMDSVSGRLESTEQVTAEHAERLAQLEARLQALDAPEPAQG